MVPAMADAAGGCPPAAGDPDAGGGEGHPAVVGPPGYHSGAGEGAADAVSPSGSGRGQRAGAVRAGRRRRTGPAGHRRYERGCGGHAGGARGAPGRGAAGGGPPRVGLLHLSGPAERPSAGDCHPLSGAGQRLRAPGPGDAGTAGARGCGDLSHRPGRHRDCEDPVSVQRKDGGNDHDIFH